MGYCIGKFRSRLSQGNLLASGSSDETIDQIGFLCPTKVWRALFVCKSKTMILLSSPALAKYLIVLRKKRVVKGAAKTVTSKTFYFPSGEKAKATTEPWCPVKTRTELPEAISQNRIDLSVDPVAMKAEFGWNFTHCHDKSIKMKVCVKKSNKI